MATIVLQAAGAFLGGYLGTVGAAIGSAAGAVAGYLVDRTLLQSGARSEGPRLSAMQLFTAEEGAPLPRLYGTARLPGVMIWATRFQERARTERQGAKGGQRVTTYSYSANIAFALCEGPVGYVRRVWADGRELDLEEIEMRVHTGDGEQLPDPLIEARQSTGAPAYRGTAYVVFDDFPLDDYGNRVPQFQFEVVRPVGDLERRVRGVALLPGATEYGLSTTRVTREQGPGETITANRHVLRGGTDLHASLDELQALCPALENVALVVTWFGTDLRAGNCTIRPAVTQSGADFSMPWLVSGVERSAAMVVSEYDGGAAYGGTPSDKSVMQAIAEIKRRGLKVTLHPFVMMDVPIDNELEDPYGAAAQAPYPWRGRVTCNPAPTRPGSADKTSAARTQIEAFCGSAGPGDFTAGPDTIVYGGSAANWGYRRFLLHHAHLAKQAGGVDAFLIGSELRGLTTLRDESGAFPFVEVLRGLAVQVRSVLGLQTAITYGADWTEYFGHQPADGSGDALFHLDRLWAEPAVTAVGIDNYMPLSDWRDEDYGGGNPDGFAGPYDPAGLRQAIDSGEGYDWYYGDDAARQGRSRTPITDGAYGKPWVYRYKDLVGWWSNFHHDRLEGVENPVPTDWMPRSKPIWLMELGCPATDKGPNQPNVFPDPKSSEGRSPYFSSGGRSDLALMRFLSAHFDHWDPASQSFDPAKNPISPDYDGPMVDPSRIYLWAWDARPFPAFPTRAEVWADGGNWFLGHWLNGRFGKAAVADIIARIAVDHALPEWDTEGVDGSVHGYVVAGPATARAAIEPLLDLFGIAVREEGGGLVFATAGRSAEAALAIEERVVEDERPAVARVLDPDHAVATEASLTFRDPFKDYQSASVRVVRPDARGSAIETIDFAGMLETGEAEGLASDWLRRAWHGRRRVDFAVAAQRRDIAVGGLVRLGSGDQDSLVTGIEEGLVRRVSARRFARLPPFPHRVASSPATAMPVTAYGPPVVSFLDLPLGPAGGAPHDQFRVAAFAKPWTRQAVLVSPEGTGFAERGVIGAPAVMGELLYAAPAGFEGRLDPHGSLTVRLYGGELASVTSAQLLNGANAAALFCMNGEWEVLQFLAADEIEPSVWRLSGLLRGQLGTLDATAAGADAGARFILLDGAPVPAGLLSAETGLSLTWKVGPAAQALAAASFVEQVAAGGVRSLIPLSPVHLRARHLAGGDIAVSWTRRGRIDADSWLGPDIPLGEETEAYRVEIAAASGTVVRSAETPSPAWTYPEAAIAGDFPDRPAAAEIIVRQLSAAVGAGAQARIALTILITSRKDKPWKPPNPGTSRVPSGPPS